MSEFQEVVKEGAETVKRGIGRLFMWIFALALVGALIFVWVSGWTYSDGTRTGELIKISKKGVVFKTYEGQLNQGGLQPGEAAMAGTIWEFSTTSDEVYEELQTLEGGKVKLHYRERYKPMPWQGKTHYFIDKVERVDR